MTKLTVLSIPDPRLKAVAQPVEAVDDNVRQLMTGMLETMYADDGFGLAATQVGVAKRVIVIDLNAGEPEKKPDIYMIANPEIVWASEEVDTQNEACLSVPDAHAPVTRPVRIKIKYLDENNKTIERDADGIFARCLQHEIDHLDGVLYIDYLSRLKRDIIVRKIVRAQRYQ